MAKRTNTEIILSDSDFNIVKIYDSVDPNQDIFDHIKKKGYITTWEVNKLRGFRSKNGLYVLDKLTQNNKLVKNNVWADLKAKNGAIKKQKISLYKLPPTHAKNK